LPFLSREISLVGAPSGTDGRGATVGAGDRGISQDRSALPNATSVIAAALSWGIARDANLHLGKTSREQYRATIEEGENRWYLWRPDHASFDSRSIFEGALVEAARCRSRALALKSRKKF
jgi:hypothetical protein